jgi:hypothetical protein
MAKDPENGGRSGRRKSSASNRSPACGASPPSDSSPWIFIGTPASFGAFLLLGRHHNIATRFVVELGGSMGARLIVVSNRVAVPDSPGTPFAGGVAVAVKTALKNHKGMWVGWSGKAADEPADASQAVELNKVAYVLIDLSKNDIQEYYNGLTNSVLWRQADVADRGGGPQWGYAAVRLGRSQNSRSADRRGAH